MRLYEGDLVFSKKYGYAYVCSYEKKPHKTATVWVEKTDTMHKLAYYTLNRLKKIGGTHGNSA